MNSINSIDRFKIRAFGVKGFKDLGSQGFPVGILVPVRVQEKVENRCKGEQLSAPPIPF